jgi:hypothetical protein
MRYGKIRYQLRILISVFLILISIVKAAMNAPHLCKLRKDYLTGIGKGAMVLTKRLHFFIFQLPKAEERPLRTCKLRKG